MSDEIPVADLRVDSVVIDCARIGFQQVLELKSVKNRLRLDLSAKEEEAAALRWKRSGPGASG